METNSHWKKFMLNPAEYLAGSMGLLVGFIGMLITVLAGYYTRGHLDGVVDMHLGKQFSLLAQTEEVFLVWIITFLALFISAKIISKTSFRIIDLLGTLAIARIPLILLLPISYFCVPSEEVLKKLTDTSHQIAFSEVAPLLVIGIVSFVFIAWVCVLMYNAFCTSCNVKGKNALISFIIAMLAAEILSKIIFRYIF